MAYDPFAPGPFRVATTTGELVDPQRDRRLPYEVWRPVSEHPDRFPLILYSHASYGHRRQSALLLTHLASHGYVVAAADHTGNTAAEWGGVAAGAPALPAAEREARIARMISHRVPDLRFLLDALLSDPAGVVSSSIEPTRIGLLGWSFGGWAVLATLEQDDRFGAVVAMAPAGSSKPLPGIIPATLTFAWKREVPALYLVAERDRFTPLDGEHELFARAPSPKRMFVLGGADHGHFADEVGEPGECPPDSAHAFTRGLALAHFDATLKSDRGAAEFMERDVPAKLSRRGIRAVSASVDLAQ